MSLRHGIKVHGYSSDGDPRLLAAMRNQMSYETKETCYMQDGIHGGLKLRTCFLRSHAALPMGNKLASPAHLKALIRDVPKSVHGLVLHDVCPINRQNFKSLEKCMSLRTRNALVKYVPDSEATSFFLKLCFQVTSSLMDYEITPYERIEMIFHAVYYLRIWRKWILQSHYILRENFITLNAYLCIELNAANLLKLIRIFRNEEKEELFLPTLFDSQACERAFRQLRSMGTPNFTKINFTLFELLHMVRRLEVQNDILYTKLAGVDIKLPKLEKQRKTTTVYALPTEEEIEQCLNRAKRFAVNDASQFGMHIDSSEIENCEIFLPNELDSNDSEEMSDYEDWSSDDEFSNENADNINAVSEDDVFLEEEEEENQHRAFITVTDHMGQQKLMRKSTLVWSLCEGTKKISSDRLIRVQEKNNAINPNTSNEASTRTLVYVSKHIKLGDWCFFKIEADAGKTNYIFGFLNAFRFANRRLVKDKTYKFDSVNLLDKPNLSKEIEVLSTWYMLTDKGALVPTKVENHFFISMEKYIATVSVNPRVDPDTKALFYDMHDFKEIETHFQKIIA